MTRRKIFVALASVVIILLLVLVGFPGVLKIRRSVVEHQYRLAGMGMTNGCNALMANLAQLDVFAAENRLAEAKQAGIIGTHEIDELQAQCLAAKRKLEFWETDLRKRGHRGRVPIYKDANNVPQDTR
jgi:hypothetical protein